MFVKPLRKDRSTPMTFAAHRGHIKIARLLHERNVDPWKKEYLLIVDILVMLLFLILLVYSLCGVVFKTLLMFVITSDTFKDFKFCLRNSPKLDY